MSGSSCGPSEDLQGRFCLSSCCMRPIGRLKASTLPWISLHSRGWSFQLSLQPFTGPTMHHQLEPEREKSELELHYLPTQELVRCQWLLFSTAYYLPDVCQLPYMAYLICSLQNLTEQGLLPHFTDRKQAHKAKMTPSFSLTPDSSASQWEPSPSMASLLWPHVWTGKEEDLIMVTQGLLRESLFWKVR